MNNSLDIISKPTIGIVSDYYRPGSVEGARAYAEENNLFIDARWSVRGDWIRAKPNWDGMIYRVASLVDHELLKRLQSWNILQISLSQDTGTDWVAHDWREAGVLAVNELMNLTPKVIVAIPFSPRATDIEYVRGAKEECEKNGIKFVTVGIHDEKPQQFASDGGAEWLAQVLSDQFRERKGRIGCCVAHASIAFDTEAHLLKRGLSIPDDIAFVVIDKDTQGTAATAPIPLSVVEPDEWHQGFIATELLAQRLRGRSENTVSRSLVTPKGVIRRESTGGESASTPILGRALSFIRENFREAISVDDVADAAGVSRRVVELRFRDAFKRGVHEEVIRLRLELACELLQERSTKVAEIAQRCGFSSLSYFSSAFRKAEGCSPRDWRKDHGVLSASVSKKAAGGGGYTKPK